MLLCALGLGIVVGTRVLSLDSTTGAPVGVFVPVKFSHVGTNVSDGFWEAKVCVGEEESCSDGIPVCGAAIGEVGRTVVATGTTLLTGLCEGAGTTSDGEAVGNLVV